MPDSSTVTYIWTASAEVIPGALDGPQALYTTVETTNGYVTKAHIFLPDNIKYTAGLNDPDGNGCDRIKKLLGHEVGHGYFGGGHYDDSIMEGYDENLPWGGLDSLPLGPTPCDRDQEKFGRTYEGQTAAGGVEGCGDGIFEDSRGCHCSVSSYMPQSKWAAYNHKPYGHIQWPPAGLHAPFSGTLDMHATDVDGDIWFVDYFVNGQYLLRAYAPNLGFPINVTPGSYYLETAIYDNRGEYTMGTPKQVNVCGGPPPQVSPVYHEVAGGWVNVYWQNPQPGFVGAYLVEGGTYPGGANVGSWNVGNTAAWAGLWVGPVGSGTYYVRVKAWNPCGFAVASPDITIVVP